MEVDMTLVHAAHCCAKHGCKYGNADCPVQAGNAVQEHSCELCELKLDDEDAAPVIAQVESWLEKRIAELEARWSDRSEPFHIQHAAMQKAHYYRDVVRELREGAWKA